MTISINAKILIKELAFVKNAIGKKSINAMFNCFKMDVNIDEMVITATNLETACVSSVYLEEPSKNFSFCVEYSFFMDIVSQFSDVITISYDEKNIEITCGNAKYIIPTYDVNDYPQLSLDTDENVMAINYSLLNRGISVANTSVSIDSLRPQISGVLLDCKNKYIVGAEPSDMTLFSAALDGKENIFIHKDYIPLISGINSNDTISIYSNDKYYKFEVGHRMVFLQKNDSQYIDYIKFFEDIPANICDINRNELLQKLQRLMASNKENVKAVRMHFALDGLTLKSESFNFGITGEERIDVSSTEEIHINFNIKLLINLLNSLESSTLQLSFKNNAMYIISENIKQLVMSIKI